MKRQTGETYESGKFAKMLTVAGAKDGKTVTLVCGALGVLPWQTKGGIVSRPENLHVLTADSAALEGIQEFILKTCGASKEALKFNVYNMQDDTKKAFASKSEYDGTFYGTLMSALDEIRQKAQGPGTHAFIASSLTTFASAVLRGVSGPAGVLGHGGMMKKSVMDQNKWSQYGSQMSQFQNYAQQDIWHCFWEAHLTKKPSGDKDDAGQQQEKDSISVPGSAGTNWAANTDQVVRFRRQHGQKWPGSKCDKTFMDTRAALDFNANGRGFNERLEAQEPCMTELLMKLGKQVGNWGQGAKKPMLKAVPLKKAASDDSEDE